MSTDSLEPGPVAAQILAYLSAHPDAQDTVEGIAEWWLLEQRISDTTTAVREALAELVARGMASQHIGRDGRILYAGSRRQKHSAVTPVTQRKRGREKP
jgi:hypothetical protein